MVSRVPAMVAQIAASICRQPRGSSSSRVCVQHAATRARCHARKHASERTFCSSSGVATRGGGLAREGSRGRARAEGLARAVVELLESGDAVVERQAHSDEGTCEGEQGHEKAAPVRTHVVCAHGSCQGSRGSSRASLAAASSRAAAAASASLLAAAAAARAAAPCALRARSSACRRSRVQVRPAPAARRCHH